MEINKYKVRVDFDLALMQGRKEEDRLVSELNLLFHETVKLWAKDHEVLATPTRTTLQGDANG